jgi:CubicO group peptidase (beta-lactamase class C family)
MPRTILVAILVCAFAARSGVAQEPKTNPPAKKAPNETQIATQQDHKKMMELLKIEKLRPGANGSNREAANYANYDESKANPYPTLPDPLILKSGAKVATAEAWWNQRRPEIVEDFDREIYGRAPKETPKVTWEVTATTTEKNGEVPIIVKKLVGHVDNSSYPQINVDIRLTLTTPAEAPGPVPVMMEFGFGGFGPRPGGPAAKVPFPVKAQPGGGGPTWQQQVLAKGWGYAILVPGTIQADNGAGLTKGIIGLCNKGQDRKVDDWGSLRAWAWGAARALDYFETDKGVDAKQVGIVGHSRYGKAALVTMAYDPRFAIAYVSSSGEGGAKIHRRNWGELVENVAAPNEYHWMAGSFLKYAGPLNWNDLPVDSHELVALCAPRPVFIGAGATNGDGWADARGSFLAAAGAGPVYKVLGKKDLGTTDFPTIDTPLIEGDLGFRQHAGGHTPGPNWPTFLAFAERFIKAPKPNARSASAVQESAEGTRSIPAISERLRRFVEDKEVAGVVTLVATPDQIVHLDALGNSDIAQTRSMQPEAIFWIASMTKPITGTAVLMLQDEGKLSVDDPVEKHLPEFKDLKAADGKPARVTIRHLLTHTSGMGEISGAEARVIKDLAGIVPLYVAKPVQFEPGSKWTYCQSGINTAARIVEVVSGLPFDRFVEQRLFTPLGMKDTTFYLSEEQLPRLATSYRRTDKGELNPTAIGLLNGKAATSRDRFPAANGGLFSTATDYSRFCRMILNGGELNGKRYVKPESVELMTSVQTGNLKTGFTPGNGWGLGWCVTREPQGVTAMLSPGTFGHGGAYGTQAWIDPVKKRAYILMIQRADYPNSDGSEVRKAFQETANASLDSSK